MRLANATTNLTLTPSADGAPAFAVFANFVQAADATTIAGELDRALGARLEPDKTARQGSRINFNRGATGYNAVRAMSPTLDLLLSDLESKEFFDSSFLPNVDVLRRKGLNCRSANFDPAYTDHEAAVLEPDEGALRVGLAVNVAISFGGYEREPHTDNRHKILVGLIYLDDINQSLGGGTIFWDLKEPRPTERCIRSPSTGEVREAATVQPRRGRLALFANSNDGYHGVSAYTGSTPRHFIYFSYFSACQRNVWRAAKP